jgi:nitrite reductase/ring-hydroxylating ferredoxin subunit
VVANLYVEAPAVTPLPYGLLAAAVVIDQADGHWAMGVEYEPLDCGPAQVTGPMCAPAVDGGTSSASVGTTRNLTLTLTGAPAGTYRIDWGDGASSTLSNPATPATHTYAAAGTYTIIVTGPQGYRDTVTVTVTNGTATGPFTGDPTSKTQKTVDDGVDLVTSDGFTVYRLQSCRAVGEYDRAVDRATRTLALGEGRAVEEAVQAMMEAASPTVLTGTLHPVDALAQLEAAAAAAYGGVPTIHVPRDLGAILAAHGAIDRYGARLETKQGSLVASGGGYTGNAMYATGTVVLRRGPVSTAGPIMQTNPRDNTMHTLAERPYQASLECIVLKQLTTGVFCCPTGAVSSDPQSGEDANAQAGADTITGPGATWTPPPGNLRHVTVTVTTGSAEVDGQEVTAPHAVDFDADTGQVLAAPAITASSAGDQAVVSWVVTP